MNNSPHLKNISSRDIGQTGSGARSKDPDTASSSGLAGQHAERERGGAIFEMGASFWAKLKKPIMAMAPMANVTDAAFRQIFAEIGRPDVFWTEFVSVEGLLSEGREQLLVDFWYGENEHPIVAQVFGDKPEQFEEVARLVSELGFDGLDINMGCPDKGIEKSGAGAALIKTPELAKEIIRAAKRGLSRAQSRDAKEIPVSVKTRIGYRSRDEMDTWLTALLEENLAALTVHLRTRNEMSDVSAHWELAGKINDIRCRYSPGTVLLGNGDVATLSEAHARASESGMDGIMIGRGMFGNPWFFSGKTPSVHEKLIKMVEHTELFEKMYKSNLPKNEGGIKNFDIMKKHFKAYCSGFDGAKELRIKLMGTENAVEVEQAVKEFLRV